MPPYSDREGGAVCSLAIARYATATVSIDDHATSRPDSSAPVDDSLIRAALRRSDIPDIEARIDSDFPVGAGLGGSSAAGNGSATKA